MTLMDIMNKGLNKKYKIQVRCKNCGEVQEVSVPKGITIEDYFKQGMGKCENCGCSTLEHLKSFLENTHSEKIIKPKLKYRI